MAQPPIYESVRDGFIVSYINAYGGWYFQHLRLAEQFLSVSDPSYKQKGEELIRFIRSGINWFNENLPAVNRVGSHLQLPFHALPQNHDEYFKWSEHYHQAFMNFYGHKSMPAHFVMLGFSLGDLTQMLELIRNCFMSAPALSNPAFFLSKKIPNIFESAENVFEDLKDLVDVLAERVHPHIKELWIPCLTPLQQFFTIPLKDENLYQSPEQIEAANQLLAHGVEQLLKVWGEWRQLVLSWAAEEQMLNKTYLAAVVGDENDEKGRTVINLLDDGKFSVMNRAMGVETSYGKQIEDLEYVKTLITDVLQLLSEHSFPERPASEGEFFYLFGIQHQEPQKNFQIWKNDLESIQALKSHVTTLSQWVEEVSEGKIVF